MKNIVIGCALKRTVRLCCLRDIEENKIVILCNQNTLF